MDDQKLTAAILQDRQNYENLRNSLNPADLPEAAQAVVVAAGEQYQRDKGLSKADPTVLRTQIERRFGRGGMASSVLDYVAGLPRDVSGVNIAEEYRLLQLARVSTTLATLLASGHHGDDTQEYLDKYKSLLSGGAGEEFKERLELEDFEGDAGTRIPVYPDALNTFIGGGLLPGHNVAVYGRPDSGKSMFALNMAAGFLRDGRRVLYVANEEPATEITKRLLSRLTGIGLDEMMRDQDKIHEALHIAKEAGWYDNWFLLHKAGCAVSDVDRAATRVNPDLVVVDQIKNLQCADDNRALQLDTLARRVREIGIGHKCITLSVTQAGESAHNRLALSMGDVEWSNTGIPGAADLMIGIGVDDEYLATGKRMLSIPKNKINGKHGSYTVFVDPNKTAFTSRRQV